MAAPCSNTARELISAAAGSGIVGVDPHHGERLPNYLTGAGVVVGPIVNGEHLQTAALREVTGHVRDEAVEAGGSSVLGLVDDPGARIDRSGLVNEATHFLERDGRDLVVRRGGDLEVVAVILFETLCFARRGLLARQPRAPRGRSTGAVYDRAVERDEVPDELPVAVGGDRTLERGVAAHRPGVVSLRRVTDGRGEPARRTD